MRGVRQPQHCAEAPRVVIAQDDAIAEFKVDVVMDAFGRGILVNAQTAGHAEMDEQRLHTQPEQQILASSLDLFDHPAYESLRQVFRNRPAQSAVVESDRKSTR